MFFNFPRGYYLNLIESAFSVVRHLFRKRPLVHTLEEEAAQIINFFFEHENKGRFTGFFRNHIRMLKKYLLKHSSVDNEDRMAED